MLKKQKNHSNNILIISWLLLVMFFSFGVDMRSAKAQLGIPQPVISTEVVSVPTTQQTIWQRITKTLENVWKKNGSRAYQQAIRSVTYKLAQDTATFVASGGKGQKPLIFEDPINFLKGAGDQVAGDFLVKLADGLPIDLCSASNIKSKLAIDIGINKTLMGRKYGAADLGKPGCKLSSITNNFAEAAKAKNFLVDVSTTFEPGKNDITRGIALFEEAKLAEKRFEAAEIIRRTQPADAKALQDVINKNPTTPRELIIEAQNDAAKRAKENPPRTEDIFIDTFAVFTNTLTKTYLQKLAKGYYPFKKTSGGPDVGGELGGVAGSVKALLASFDVFSPQRAATINTTGEIDLFSDMISCPPPQYQSPYNCLLNDGLQQAIQQGLSVEQALDKGLLDGNLSFPETHDPNKPTLSLANLRKLRFLRVLPIGWEIAAEKLSQAKTTKTLAHVVACFNGKNDGCTLNPGNDLLKLVDPGWVLALPQQYCRAEGISQVPEGEKSPSRRQWCVDLQSCIKEDSSGNCEAFGYCTRERAVWKLQGEECNKQYATCQVLRRPDGTTVGQGKTTGILGSDVNKTGCTQANAGCTWFSTAGSDKNWAASSRIYLTNLAPSCRAEDAGSREIIPLEAGTNLIRSASARETVEVRRYTYYTLSFSAEGDQALTATVAGTGITNISFSGGNTDSLSLSLPASSSGRYAATFFNQGSDSVVVTFNNNSFSRAQLEEVGFNDGKRARAEVGANRTAGVEVLNVSPSGSRNPASPATNYKPYAENRKLVFAGAKLCGEPTDPTARAAFLQTYPHGNPEESSARKYTPVNGGESKVARLAAGDLCPDECVGLDSYLAMPTRFEPDSKPEQKSFIAQYARACPAAEVGCEEFTNLTTQANGAEKREYFSQVRSCVLDTNSNAATFYTWEGTDTAGFQLKSWQLLKDESGAPCNNFPPGSTDNPLSAACAGSAAACTLDEANPNCRVFLDETGQEFRRDASKVVTASNQCAGYRRSQDGETWYFLAKESKQCSSANVGCREYKGARANVATRLLYSNFENAGNHGWSQQNGNNAIISSASVVAGKNSMQLSDKDSRVITSNLRGTTDSTFLLNFIAKQDGGGKIKTIGLYEGRPDVDFNGDGQINQGDFTAFQAAFNQSATGKFTKYDINKNNIVDLADFFEFAKFYGAETRHADFDITSLNLPGEGLTNDWQEYKFGPLQFNVEGQAPVYILALESEGTVFVDNIELLASPTQFYITDSWVAKQPAACSAYKRCEAYKDDNNNTFYTSRFAKLFSDDSAYCRAVIDTQNSNAAGPEEFNKDAVNDNPDDNYTVAADKLDYRIIKPENLRPATAAGCTALGVPNDTATTTPSWIGTTYRVIDPDTFAQGSLCKAAGLGCQNFKNDQGESLTFRDPGKKLCAWDANENIFVKIDIATGLQTKESCYAGRLDNDLSTWYVAQCPAEQSSCTAYAPTDASLTEGASSALFMTKDTVEVGNCKAGDGISAGCVNFTEGYAAGDIREDQLFKARESLLSVKATRQCAEWLSPTTSSKVNDPKTRSQRTVVYDLGRCHKLDANGRCLVWTNQTQATYPRAYFNAAGELDKFQTSQYANRFAGGKSLFSGAWDYSGYSAPNQYPLELLQEQKNGNSSRLVYNNDPINAIPELAGLNCRSFPEEDSPFASDRIDIDPQAGTFLYSDATRHLESINKCEPGEACQCTYKKVSTSEGAVRYYNSNTSRPFPKDTKSITDLTGWQGYCAEWDEETRDPNDNPVCLAWWPIDVVQNGINIFDNHPEAGFTSAGPQYYCLAAKGNNKGNKLNDSNQGLTTEKSDKNNYFVKVSDWKKNFGDSRELIGDGETGWPGSSGILEVKAVNTSALYNLKEYDIESIVLKVKKRQAGDWPSTNDEMILQRAGFAKSTSSTPETTDRWTALWCGGSGEEKCEFNDLYTWEKFAPLIALDSWTCQSSYIGYTNLSAIRARFADAQGKAGDWGEGYQPYQFLGFQGGLCDASKESGSVNFDIIFQLREWCTTVAAVNQSGTNKAWTGRLNQKSESSVIAAGLFNANASPETLVVARDGFGLNYKYAQDKAPFGAIVPPAPTIYLPVEWDSRKDEEIPDESAGEQEIKILEPGKQPLYVEVDRKQVRAGSPYSCPENKCTIPPIAAGSVIKQPDLGRAVSYLQELFAKIYKIWTWDDTKSEYKENSTIIASAALDLDTKNPSWLGECPIIQSGASTEDNDSGEGDCRQPDFWGYYSVGSKAITHNNQHVLSDGWKPYETKIGEEVALQFYAYNDNGEQLPLAKIEIDWQDGIKTIVSGSYKNHRPTCDNASQNYGKTNKACDPNLFEFKHSYTRVGSFIPVVTVWDNWGRFTVATYTAGSGNKGVIKVGEPDLSKITYTYNIASGKDAKAKPSTGPDLPAITPPPPPPPPSSPTGPTAPSGYTYCAEEGNVCNFSGRRDVRYGVNPTFITKTFTATTDCNNIVFTDPVAGTKKYCFYSDTTK